MRKHAFLHRLLALLTALLLLCAAGSSALAEKVIALNAADYPVTEDGWYLSMEEVAVYLATFDHLPDSFIKKNDAMRLGWDSRSGNLDHVAPGKAIGGDRFGNYEGTLPDQNGRRWTECDVNYDGGYRDSQRIVFSNDGLMYYTNDHYNTFTRIQVSFDAPTAAPSAQPTAAVSQNPTDRDVVAAYLHAYGKLPALYLTKTAAKKLGWVSGKDNLGEAAPGRAIGGSQFENREGRLPAQKGRTYFECDVNVVDGHRGSARLVYSNDGLIYYTEDGYRTFTCLYGGK